MAVDVSKCRAGVPAVGGRPKQCPLVFNLTTTVYPADKPASESVQLCSKHAAELIARQVITLYREDDQGRAIPVRATS